MKTYQLVLRGGLTRTVEATGYRRDQQNLVFTSGQRCTVKFALDDVIMIEEIRDLPSGLLSMSDRWGHRLSVPQFA
jgi:hypothetical protein